MSTFPDPASSSGALGSGCAARLRSFLTDEAGATSLDYFMISAFFSAVLAIAMETMGYSLYATFKPK